MEQIGVTPHTPGIWWDGHMVIREQRGKVIIEQLIRKTEIPFHSGDVGRP